MELTIKAAPIVHTPNTNPKAKKSAIMVTPVPSKKPQEGKEVKPPGA